MSSRPRIELLSWWHQYLYIPQVWALRLLTCAISCGFNSSLSTFLKGNYTGLTFTEKSCVLMLELLSAEGNMTFKPQLWLDSEFVILFLKLFISFPPNPTRSTSAAQRFPCSSYRFICLLVDPT